MIRTKRLILRPWTQADFEPFAQLNADPRVMEYFPSTLSRSESDRQAEKISDLITKQGWGLWAVSVPGVAEFIGFVGLNTVTFSSHFTPAVEIGWRLAYDFWGRGYALEGSQAALNYAFSTLHLKEVVAFTAVQNMRSIRLMDKLDMHHDPKDDFDHPNLPPNSPLKRHVLYRISASKKKKRSASEHGEGSARAFH